MHVIIRFQKKLKNFSRILQDPYNHYSIELSSTNRGFKSSNIHTDGQNYENELSVLTMKGGHKPDPTMFDTMRVEIFQD